MTQPEILITINGMGDPESGDTYAWPQALFPGSALVSRNGRRTLELDGRTIHLFEVLYEAENEAVRAKFEVLGQLLPQATPEKVKDTLEDYALDVVQNVLLKGALEAAQLRFVEAYAQALDRALELVGPSGSLQQAKIGVLSHSLGTLVAYEGICRAFDTDLFVQVVDVNVVMCAPMLSPIYHVLNALGADRYLTRYGCAKPYRRTASHRWYSMIRRCQAIYDRRDPFFRIQDLDFYERTPTYDLVDELRMYESSFPLSRFWEAHSMEASYLRHNREAIAAWLF
jgi:hypothetical protein